VEILEVGKLYGRHKQTDQTRVLGRGGWSRGPRATGRDPDIELQTGSIHVQKFKSRHGLLVTDKSHLQIRDTNTSSLPSKSTTTYGWRFGHAHIFELLTMRTAS
jgi:hypothetical protein